MVEFSKSKLRNTGNKIDIKKISESKKEVVMKMGSIYALVVFTVLFIGFTNGIFAALMLSLFYLWILSRD